MPEDLNINYTSVYDDLQEIKTYFQENFDDCYPLALDIAISLVNNKIWEEVQIENVQFSKNNE